MRLVLIFLTVGRKVAAALPSAVFYCGGKGAIMQRSSCSPLQFLAVFMPDA